MLPITIPEKIVRFTKPKDNCPYKQISANNVYMYFKYISVPSGNIYIFYKPQTKLKPSQANILPVLSQKDPYVITFEPFVRFSNFKKVNQLKFCQGSKNSIGYSLSKKIGPKIVF